MTEEDGMLRRSEPARSISTRDLHRWRQTKPLSLATRDDAPAPIKPTEQFDAVLAEARTRDGTGWRKTNPLAPAGVADERTHRAVAPLEFSHVRTNPTRQRDI